MTERKNHMNRASRAEHCPVRSRQHDGIEDGGPLGPDPPLRRPERQRHGETETSQDRDLGTDTPVLTKVPADQRTP